MKKAILFVTACIAIVTFSFAQEGSWYVGGNVGFSSSKTKAEISDSKVETGKFNSWTFSPEIGTFLTDNIQTGIGITLQGTEQENVSKSTQTGATLYGRYFLDGGAFRPFGGLNITALPGSLETTTGINTNEFSTFTFGVNVNAGFGYALSEKVTAVGSFGLLGFNSSSQKNKDTDAKTTTNTFGLDAGTLGNRFTVGVYFTL